MVIKNFITKILSSKVVTVILSILNGLILILSIGHLINEFSYYSYRAYERTADNFEYNFNDGYYSEAVKGKHSNEINGYEADSLSMKEYYALVDYYEAGIKYEIAKHKEDTKEMKKQVQIMEENKEKISIYSYILDDMDKVLNNAK